MTRGGLSALAVALGLDVDEMSICLACLSFVSMSCGDDGERREARRWARRMAPDLWEEGLKEPALRALRRARMAGIEDAVAALGDAEARGGRSAIAREIVLALGEQLAERERASWARWEARRTADRRSGSADPTPLR
jgi:hypothetical protein